MNFNYRGTRYTWPYVSGILWIVACPVYTCTVAYNEQVTFYKVQQLNNDFQLKGDQLYMAVCFSNLVKCGLKTDSPCSKLLQKLLFPCKNYDFVNVRSLGEGPKLGLATWYYSISFYKKVSEIVYNLIASLRKGTLRSSVLWIMTYTHFKGGPLNMLRTPKWWLTSFSPSVTHFPPPFCPVQPSRIREKTITKIIYTVGNDV